MAVTMSIIWGHYRDMDFKGKVIGPNTKLVLKDRAEYKGTIQVKKLVTGDDVKIFK